MNSLQSAVVGIRRRSYEGAVTLETPLAELEWMPHPRVRQLERLGLATAGALLYHFPRRYEDRNQFDRFPTDTTDHPVCVCGIVKKTVPKRIRGFQRMFDVLIEEPEATAFGGRLLCRWFNSPWVEKMIAQGHQLVVYGKPKRSGSNIIVAHPEFEVIENDAEESIHLRRIVPIHGATEGLSPRVMRSLIWNVLEQLCDDEVPPLLPAKLDATDRAWALRQMHFPENLPAQAQAQRHVILEEFLSLQLTVAARRAELHAERGERHSGSGEWMQRLHASLPFPLTGAQQRAIAEIRADLAAPHPMNRLLQGDVGSGKTLVTLSAMLLCAEAGYQAALMAPTQILAEQHYLNFRRLLDPLGIRVALRTGARREDSGEMPLFEIKASPSADGVPTGSTGVPPVGSGDSPEPPLARSASPGANHTRRLLPHFERPWAKYAIVFTTTDRRQLSPAARDIVLDFVLHQHERRYTLYATCVMPDHVHLLIEPSIKSRSEDGSPEFFPLSEILHSLKSFTAHKINELAGVNGPLWQQERFDRYIRSDRDLEEKFEYICDNPKRDGLVERAEDYPWLWYPSRAQDAWWLALRARASEAGRLGQQAGRLCYPEQISAPLPSSEPQVFVGTHALLYEGAGFSRLGLVVVDEQHKFGVMQRARLRAQGTAPDVLVMTATPIPRTLTMTLFGDLDVSTLDELPAGRGRIITGVRAPASLPDAAKFIREQLEGGRQCYIVYPLIDQSEKLEAKAAAAEIAKWTELLAPMKCELLHGRIPPEEKEAIMARFRAGTTKALIATTVIEVGVDVPNASVMLIENAERFGLAQLHQLRGRIGRGAHKSYCVLITSTDDREATEKLKILERTSDGFEIADADFRLRGPGDMLGTAQSGLPPLGIGDLQRDAALMQLARNHAFLIFETDPELARPEHAGCRELLQRRQAGHAQVS